MPLEFSKIIDLLAKSRKTSTVIVIFLTSLLIALFNYFPEKILVKMKLLTFLNDYNSIVIIVLFGSFFFLIARGIIGLYRKITKNIEKKRLIEERNKKHQELFDDPDAYKILKNVYEHHPNSVRLSINNQKVCLLSKYGLIVAVSNISQFELYEDWNDTNLPFVLKPIAEEKLRSIQELER